MIKHMDLVLIFMLMVLLMREIGKKINSMVEVKRNGVMEQSI